MTRAMAKERPNHFAADNMPGWYRPLTARKAQALLLIGPGDVEPKPVLYVPPKAAPDGQALVAHDSHALLEATAHASAGARLDLARHVVDYLVEGGEEVLARYRRLTQARLEDNLGTIKGRPDLTVEAGLYGDKDPFQVPWFSDEFPKADRAALERQLWQARNINFRLSRGDIAAPQEDWQQHLNSLAHHNLQADIVVGDTLLYMGDHWDQMGERHNRERAAAMLANQLDADALMRVVDDIDPHCGLRPTAEDGKPMFELRSHISALALATRHWDEVNAGGQYPGGIDLKAAKKRLYPADAVEPVGTAVTTIQALDEAKMAPEAAATVIMFTPPSRRSLGP